MNKPLFTHPGCRWTFLFLPVVLISSIPARAIAIDFETLSGYSTAGGVNSNGSLTGQPSTSTMGSTTWTASDNNPANDTYRIVKDTITGSGQMLGSTNLNNGATFYTFTPSSKDLGGTFDSSSSVINFSLQYAFNTTESYIDTSTTMARVSFGSSISPIIQLELLSSGHMDFSDGDTAYGANSAGTNATTVAEGFVGDFVAPKSAFVTVSGTIDYAKGTYTLFVNGVPQQTSTDGTNLAFRPGTTKDDALNLRQLNGGGTNYVPTAWDNIKLSLQAQQKSSSLDMRRQSRGTFCFCQLPSDGLAGLVCRTWNAKLLHTFAELGLLRK